MANTTAGCLNARYNAKASGDSWNLDRTVPRSGGATIHAEFGKPMDITSRRGVGCRPAWQNFASRHVTRRLVPCRFGRRVLGMGGGNDSWWGWALCGGPWTIHGLGPPVQTA